VLLNSTCSAKHYIILINYKDVAIFHKQSKNNIIINEKVCKDYSVALYDKMKIKLQKTIFLVQVSWRQNLDQTNYVYKAKRIKKFKVATSLLNTHLITTSIYTT